MEILGDAPPQPSKEQLLAALKDPVNKLIDTDISQEIEPERQFLYRRVMQNDLYWRGLQYIAFDARLNTWVSANGVNVSGSSKEDASKTGVYDYVFNIYQGAGLKFAAVLGQRSPNVKAVADDPSDDESAKATHAADTAATIFRATWNSDKQNMDLAQRLWKSGTAFAYTPWVADGNKYGFREEPQLAATPTASGDASYSCKQCGANTPSTQVDPQNPTCPQCNAPLSPEDQQPAEQLDLPQTTGVQKYPNGAVEFQLYDLFSVSCSCFGKDVDDLSWLTLEFEEYKGKLLRAYPELRTMDNFRRDGSGNSSGSASGGLGQQVRTAQASPSGTGNTANGSRWQYKRTWLTVDTFESVDDDGLRQMLQQYYPDGLKVTLINGEIIRLENEKLGDVWAEFKPNQSEHILCDPFGQSLISIQDIKNDMENIAAETLERGIPVTLADPRIINHEQWNQHQASPAEIVLVLPNYGDSLAAGLYQLPAAAFSGQQMPWMQGIYQQAMENVGIVPAIFGGADGDQTAHEAEIKKNAALQQLGLVWLGMRKGWERAYTNGVKQLARYGSGQLKGVRRGAGGAESQILDMAELQETGWHFEAEEAIPQTWGQKRDMLMYMMEKPPNITAAYGFTDPMNIRENQSLLGFDGYVMPGVSLIDKTRAVIQKLLSGQVIQDQNGGDPQPSIPLDWEDDPTQVCNTVKAWLLDKSGRAAKDSNPDGYLNVVVYGKSAEAKIPPATPPPPPDPPGFAISGKIENIDPNLTAQVAQKHGINWTPPAPPPVSPLGSSPNLPGAMAPGAPSPTSAPLQ